MVNKISGQAKEALQELLSVANLEAGEIVVIGCSTSEVMGEKIGSASSVDTAKAIMEGLLPVIKDNDLFLAVQCCEHLNRALVVERECAKTYGLEIVSVVPKPKAGGSLASMAMERFNEPVVVETITAHAGLDIGDTFIGMHLKRVAVPVRLKVKAIGQAHLTAARHRPKLIGGERAQYK
ncbi:TIGR01440 family protein [Peptococcaceae bacterium 1198_IL3148]